MPSNPKFRFHMPALAGIAAALLVCTSPAQARITRIVIDDTQPSNLAGQAMPYEQISGRAFGELDPADPLNAIIQDINLGTDPDGRVRYVASFVLTKPVDMSRASGMMWHDVPNRGSPIAIVVAERNFGDVGLASAWQGDNSGINAANGTTVRPTMLVGGRHWLQVPVARNGDGSPVTGLVFGRIVNRSGDAAQPLVVQTNPVPYMPASLDTAQATLVSRDHETMEGVVTGEATIPGTEWKFCGGGTFASPLPLTALPVQICLNGGFNLAKLYQVVYTAMDPYVLGVGFAAWRDVGTFFKYSLADDFGTPNPVAGRVTSSIARGVSQSGNFLRGTRTRFAARFTMACGRSSPADGSRSTSAGRSPTACSSSIKPAAKAHSGGTSFPTTRAVCRQGAFSIAAKRPRPARRSSSISALPKCGPSS